MKIKQGKQIYQFDITFSDISSKTLDPRQSARHQEVQSSKHKKFSIR